MKNLIFTLILILPAYCSENFIINIIHVNDVQVNIKLENIIEHIKATKPSSKAMKAEVIAPIILKLSEQYNFNPDVVTAIIALESGFKQEAYNKKSHDYGLMQINKTTARLYGFPLTCLKDAECNIKSGLIILSDMRRMYAKKDKQWLCRYNIGTGGLTLERLEICKGYLRKYYAFKELSI